MLAELRKDVKLSEQSRYLLCCDAVRNFSTDLMFVIRGTSRKVLDPDDPDELKYAVSNSVFALMYTCTHT